MPYIAKEERELASDNPRTPGQLNYAITIKMIRAWQLKGSPLALSVMSGGVRRLFFYYWNEKIQSYTTINDIYGATACALMEFRRRIGPKAFGIEGAARVSIARALSRVVDEFYISVVAPYEDSKIQEHGDVYL